MKRRVLFWLLGIPLLSIPSYAQFEKGTTYVGTTLSFGGTSNKFEGTNIQRNNQVSIAPSILAGQFFADNRMFGVALGSELNFYRYSAKDLDYSISYNQHRYTIAPFLRHYKPIGSRFAVFFQSSLRASLLQNVVRGNNEKDTDAGVLLGLGITPGVSWRVGRQFALEADVNVLALDLSYSSIGGDKLFNFSSVATSSLNSTFSLRASWYLHK